MEIDTLDRQIVDALRVDGRAGFSRIAEVLGVSDQTVARRFRRLRTEAGVRVVGLPNGVRLGYDKWMIRVRATPGGASAIAEALARRPDTTWVTIASGGAEVTCIVQNPGTADREALLLQKLPQTTRIQSVKAHCLIHNIAGGAVDAAGPNALSPSQAAAVQPPPAEGPAVLLDSDQPLVAALARDGRTGLPELATATGWSESTVRRRLEHLLRTGALFFDVEVNPALFGFNARILLWMSVAPAHLETVGRALATHPEIVFAAATTGTTNLVATVICPDMAGLYDYLTRRVGPLPGVERVETAPALRHVKQVGAVV